MRLIREITENGHCKYALVRLDKINSFHELEVDRIKEALNVLEELEVLEYAGKDDPEEAFVIKLKDLNSTGALLTYADTVSSYDPIFAKDIYNMIERIKNLSNRKLPD